MCRNRNQWINIIHHCVIVDTDIVLLLEKNALHLIPIMMFIHFGCHIVILVTLVPVLGQFFYEKRV